MATSRSPQERLNASREIRYYPIKDLLFEVRIQQFA